MKYVKYIETLIFNYTGNIKLKIINFQIKLYA